MGLPLKSEDIRPYPREQVRATIRSWWRREQEDLQKIADPDDALQPNSGTVFDLLPVISSYQAVEVVLDLGEVLGYELPDSVIKRGGYHSCEEMVEHLDNKLSAKHAEHFE